MQSRIFKLALALALSTSFLVASSGCDMGTYNARFQERLGKSGDGGAFQVPDDESDEAVSE